jgi:signal transduction histidine kinase
MKLLAKYNLVNVATTIIVLMLSGLVYYFFIEHALVHQLDKSLVAEEKEITDYIKENNALPEPSYTRDEQEVYAPATGGMITRKFSSIKLPGNGYYENVLYRQLEFPVMVQGKIYKADVRKSQEETEDLVQLILKITLAIVLLLLVTLFIINRFVLRKIWKPFYSTLQQIKQFNVKGKDNVSLEPTNINEFAELNDAVTVMATRTIREYVEIKSFTENASHEIQTPLAIIASKLELLSQSENLEEEQMNAIQSIADTTSRLSKLNQSLLLLAKIDNRQFATADKINISAVLLRHISNYEELFHAKEITVVKNITGEVMITINETLAEILIVNLLTNAIKHNIDKGFINVGLNEKHLIVSNTGKVLHVNPAIFFERFKKDSTFNDSMGLGLSIVKKICETYGFGVTYHYENPLHIVTISFA